MGESGNTKKNESTFGDHIIAGSVAGFAECVAVQPFDMMKTRFHLNEGAANPSLYRAMGDVYREGGIMRFYRGRSAFLFTVRVRM